MLRTIALLLILVMAVSTAGGNGLVAARASPSALPTSLDEGYIGMPTAEFLTDPDGNGLFDALVLRVPFTVNISGHFYLSAYLVANDTSSGNSSERTLSPGTYVIDFALPGWRIRLSRADGPYNVTLGMYDASTGFSAGRSYRTAPYGWDTFAFLAELQGGLTERAVDANGDGLYNYLEIRGILNVAMPENYTLTAILFPDGSSFELAYAFNRTHWAPGISQFLLRFSGDSIRTYGYNGRYSVEIRLGREYLDAWQRERVDTRPYLASQFYHKPIVLRGNLTDYGSDFDGNGLFEVLRIEVPIAVTVKGVYHIYGSLTDRIVNIGTISAKRDVELSPDDVSATLDFDGLAIRDSQGTGSYNLDLYIVEDAAAYSIQTSGVTAVYDLNDFDNPYANWVPELRLTTPDFNGDGLFDELRLSGTLKVKRDATFTIYIDGSLGYGGYYQHVEQWVSVAGGPGILHVEAAFPGWRIRIGGSNGTYRFAASVYTGPSWLHTESVQANFTYDEFSPAILQRGPITNRTVDTDGDGLANQFIVRLPLRIVSAGPYTFGAYAGNRSSYVYAPKQRYLEPGDVDIEFSFSGILLRALGANISLYISASLSWGYSSFDLLALREPDVIRDPSVFQTAPTKRVTFTVSLGAPNVCCGILRLINYSNALVLDIWVYSGQPVVAAIPDVGYVGMVEAYGSSVGYSWVGRIAAPLPADVSLNLTLATFHFDELLDVDLPNWSSGHAWLNRTVRGVPSYRFLADLSYEMDAILTSEEIRNFFHFLNFGIPLDVVLRVDDSAVLAGPAGPEMGVGAGPVDSGEPIALAIPWSLGLPGGVANSHQVIVNLTGGYSYHTPSARLRMPFGWRVTEASSPPGVVVTGLGTRDVSIVVTENRSSPSDTVLTIQYGGLYGQISGRVLGSGGTPAAGVHVAVMESEVPVADVTTAADGRFQITGLAIATYEIRIQANGYSIARRTVRVADDRAFDIGDILLHALAVPMASVMGRVRDTTGTAVADVAVILLSDTGASMAETRSSSDGRFRFDDVEAGTHRVRMQSPGFLTVEIPIQVVAGGKTDLQDVILLRENQIAAAGGIGSVVLPILVGVAIAGMITGALWIVERKLPKKRRPGGGPPPPM